MRRRAFIAAIAVAHPLIAQAQPSGLPLVGFVSSGAPEQYATYVESFRAGLADEVIE